MTQIPEIQNANQKEGVADWIELYLCLSGESISKSSLISFLEQTTGDEPTDYFIGDIWREMELRHTLYGNNPPFKIEPKRIIASYTNWRQIPQNLLCLLLSIYGNNFQVQKTGQLFEEISAIAIEKYLDGSVLITGFPAKKSVKEIAQAINERFISEPSSNFKDRGVDLIAWKPFNDNRSGKIWGVFQCASGNNWKSKLNLPLNAWKQYIHTANTFPFSGFTTSQLIGNETEFYNSVVDCGVLLDRPRIFRYSNGLLHDELINQLIEWCEARIKEL